MALFTQKDFNQQDNWKLYTALTEQVQFNNLAEETGNAANAAAVKVAINAFFAAHPTYILVEKQIVWNGASFDWFITYSS